MSSMRTYSDRETDNMWYQLKNSQVTFRIDQKYSPDKVTLLSQIYKLISGVIAGRMKDPLTELMITDQTTQHNEEHGGDLDIPPLQCLRMT